MFPISGANQSYLANLDRTQSQMNQTQSEVTSGLRVQKPSDDPAAVGEILEVQNALAQNQQVQTNLGQVTAELSTADSSLQTAVSAVENAISLASEGASTTATAAQRADLAQQVQGLQQTLVGISQAQFNGRYIFSGDQDSGPMYQLDTTQPNGVDQLITSTATRQIVDASGTPISVALTAQQIFDNPNGSVFQAIQSLITGLQNNDTNAITAAQSSLKSADLVLNQQLSFYGDVEDRVQASTTLAQKFQTQEQQQLSNLRDADIPTVAVQLTQTQLDEQAALSAEARIQQTPDLFSMLA